MTRNELIERIELNVTDKCPSMDSKGKCQFGCWNCTISAAVLGIIELHQPKSSEYFVRDVCVCCTEDIDYYEYYPCKTIQTLVKGFA